MQPRLTGAHALSLQTQSLQALVPVRSEQRCPARVRLPAPPLPALPSCARALGSASSTSPLRATRVCPGRQLPGHAARRTLQHPLVSSRTLLSSTQPLHLALPSSIRHCGEKRSKAMPLQIGLLKKEEEMRDFQIEPRQGMASGCSRNLGFRKCNKNQGKPRDGRCDSPIPATREMGFWCR